MEELYQTYKDVAAIYIVYISEAHASDDRFPVPYATQKGIKEHKTYGERCAVATRLVSEKKLNIPCLIDKLDNGVAEAYRALPDRVFLIRKDGTLAVAGNPGPWGFAPAVEASRKWLAEYHETGREPGPVELVDTMAETRRIGRKMTRAYNDGRYEEALEFAQEMHRARPGQVGAVYNIACFHCLTGNHAKAYEWLEKAIDAGYDDADHLVADDDFKTIRNEERFQALVRRVRQADGGGE